MINRELNKISFLGIGWVQISTKQNRKEEVGKKSNKMDCNYSDPLDPNKSIT